MSINLAQVQHERSWLSTRRSLARFCPTHLLAADKRVCCRMAAFGPPLPTSAVHKVVSYLSCCGHAESRHRMIGAHSFDRLVGEARSMSGPTGRTPSPGTHLAGCRFALAE